MYRMILKKEKCLSSESSSTGLALLLLSAILYSIAGIFVKLAAETGLASSELVLLRAVFQGIFVIVGLCCWRDDNNSNNDDDDYGHDDHPEQHKDQPGLQRQHRLLIWQPFGATRRVQTIVVLRGMVGAAGFCFYFYTISNLPLGDAVALIALKPVPTIFLAWIFLGEGVESLHVIVTILCILGSLGIAQPSFLFHNTTTTTNDNSNSDDETEQQPHPSWGHVTGLLGACCAAGVVILIRKAGSIGAHTLQLLFSWSFFSILFSTILLWGQWRLPDSRQAWLYVLLLSLIGAVSHFLLNYAARLVPATQSAIVRSSDIMFAYLWEICIFHEVPNLYTWLGVALIATSLILIGVMHTSNNNKTSSSSSPQHQHDEEVQQDETLKPLPSFEDAETCVEEDFDDNDDDDEELELTSEAVVHPQRRGTTAAGYAKVSSFESD